MDIDPTLAYLLITVGLVGIGIETLTPGGVVPGLLGLAALVIGVLGATKLSVDGVGIGLLALAVALFIADASIAWARRAIAVAATACLALGGIFFFGRGEDATSIPIVILVSLVVGGLLLFVIEHAAQARRRPVRTGYEELLGSSARVRSTLAPDGQVFVEGALWSARLDAPGGRAQPGDIVTVESVEGLTLIVRPSSAGPPGAEDSE